MAEGKSSSISKQRGDESQVMPQRASSRDWAKDKGKVQLSLERRQWKPVFEGASSSPRPLKKIRSPERQNLQHHSSASIPQLATRAPVSSAPNPPSSKAIFLLIQAVTHLTIATIIAFEKRFQAASHPMILRVYWVANFAIVCLFAVSAIIRLSSAGWNQKLELRIDDIFFIFNIPVSTFLLLVAIRGSIGIQTTGERERTSYHSAELCRVTRQQLDGIRG